MACSIKHQIHEYLEAKNMVALDEAGDIVKTVSSTELLAEAKRLGNRLNARYGVKGLPLQVSDNRVYFNDPLFDRVQSALKEPDVDFFKENQAELQERLSTATRILADKLGLSYEVVGSIKDEDGNPVNAKAAAHHFNRAIEVVLGHEEEMDEEVIHFFMTALKDIGDPLHASIRRRIYTTTEYEDVRKEFPDENEEYHVHEAIGRVVTKRFQNPQLMDREGRWWRRTWAKLQSWFNVYKDPETKAAYKAFSKIREEHKNAVANTTETRSFYSTADATEVRKRMVEVHDNLILEREFTRETLEGKISNLEFVMKGEETIMRYERLMPDGTKVMVSRRPSDVSTARFIQSVGGLERAKDIWKRPKTERTRLAGTALHITGQHILMRLAKEGYVKGVRLINLENIEIPEWSQIKEESGLADNMLRNFREEMESLLIEMQAVQDEINSEETFDLMNEVRVYDESSDTAGTLDIMFLFSDASAGIYDYKFISPDGKNTKGSYMLKRIVVDPFRGSRGMSHDFQLSSYTRTLRDNYGITNIRRSRVIPGHVDFEWEGDKPGVINTFKMGYEKGEFLQHIPYAQEESGNKDLDKLLNKMYKRLEEIEKEKDTALTRREGNTLKRSIQDILTKANFKRLLSDIDEMIEQIETRIEIDDPNAEGYMGWDELRHSIDVLGMYGMVHDATLSYIESLPEDEQTERIANLKKASDNASSAMKMVRTKSEKRLTDAAEFPLEVVSMTTGIMDEFVPMAEVDNQYFKEIYHRVMLATDRAKRQAEELRVKWLKLDDDLESWAKRTKNKKSVAFDMLIRTTPDQRFKLITIFNEKFREERDRRIEEALTTKSGTKLSSHVKWMKERFQYREGAKEKYLERLKKKKAELLKEYGSTKNDGYKNGLDWYKSNYDVWNRDSAWVTRSWGVNLEVKPSAATSEGLWSKEYATILRPENKEVLEYFNAWKEQLRDFDEILDNHDISFDMIPSVRAGMLERKASWSLLEDVMLRPWVIQVEDDDHSVGTPPKKVPLPGINTARNKNGDFDTRIVSKDMTRIMYKFGQAVYNNVEKSNIESEVLLLRNMLAEGEELVGERNILGRKRGGALKPDDTTKETVALLDKYVNYYLYGHTMSHGDINLFKIGSKQVTATKVAKALNTAYGVLKIAAPIRIALGTQAAASIFMRIESIKGVQYSSENLTQAMKMWSTDYRNYMSAARYFNLHQEGEELHYERRLRANKADQWLDSSILFEPLTLTDRSIDRRIGIAMMLNHGIDEKGNLKRLAQLPKDSKNILELLKVKDGKVGKELPANVRLDLRKRIQFMAKEVKGDQGEENVIAMHMNLGAQLIGKFKWWMPGTLTARFGGIKYHSILDELKEGRFIGAGKAMAVGGDLIQEEKALHTLALRSFNLLKNSMLEFARIRRYRVTKAERQRLKEKNNWSDPEEEKYLKDREVLRAEMKLFKKNQTDPYFETMDEEDFFAMREASVARTFAEVRTVLILLLASMVMGAASGPDDEEFYKKAWASRRLMDIMAKIILETTFYMNPVEMLKFNKSMIPMLGLLGDVTRLLGNTAQETARLFGILDKDARDKTPLFYYTLMFVPGWNQLRKIIEMHPQDKQVRVN